MALSLTGRDDGRTGYPRRYGVVNNPDIANDFARGVRDLTSLVRQVYGPSGRSVASAGPLGGSAPELLTDGATIAKRLTELDHRLENVGAMFLRDLLVQIHELAGDGASTGALIFDTILEHGRKAIAAGHNPARLRDCLLANLAVVLESLRQQQRVPGGQADLRGLAQAVCGDAMLADEIAAIVGIIGATGSIEVRPSRHDRIGHEFIDEPYWPTRPLERTHLSAAWGMRAEVLTCAVFVSDLDLKTPADAIALLEAAHRQGAASLLVIAQSCSPECQHVLLANASPSFRVLLVATPGDSAPARWECMDDIAVRTGARAFHAATGIAAATVMSSDLGQCRRVWVTRTHVGLVGGRGDARAMWVRIAELSDRFHETEDVAARERTRLRLARLTGRGAILWINGTTDREVALNRANAERTCRVVQRAVIGGVIPGGGGALVASAQHLASREALSCDPEDRAAIAALRAGLQSPFVALAEHANLNPAILLDRLARRAPAGMNWETRQIVALEDVPHLDAFDAVETAVRLAVSGAAQALTIGTIVFPRHADRMVKA